MLFIFSFIYLFLSLAWVFYFFFVVCFCFLGGFFGWYFEDSCRQVSFRRSYFPWCSNSWLYEPKTQTRSGPPRPSLTSWSQYSFLTGFDLRFWLSDLKTKVTAVPGALCYIVTVKVSSEYKYINPDFIGRILVCTFIVWMYKAV